MAEGWVLVFAFDLLVFGLRQIVSSNVVPALSLRSSLEIQSHLIPQPCLYSAETLSPFESSIADESEAALARDAVRSAL